MRIEVLICTFRRPFLEQTLASVAAQVLPDGASLGVVVADNDTGPTARELVQRIAAGFPFALTYVHAPERNISLARNACLDTATAEYVAFLDDDETAPPGWIATGDTIGGAGARVTGRRLISSRTSEAHRG